MVLGDSGKIGHLANSVSCTVVRFMTNLFWVLLFLSAEGAGMLGAASVVVVLYVAVPVVGVG